MRRLSRKPIAPCWGSKYSPAAVSGRWGTVQVMGSRPKCSKHSWLDMPPMYLSRKYGIR